MRNLILIILILFVNFTNSQEKSDAEMLLNKVSENIKGYNNVFINYEYRLNNDELDIDEKNAGSFVKEKDKWKFEFVGITRIFDGSKLFTISPEDEEVTVSSENPEEESTITPNKMLYFYEDGYTVTMDKIEYLKNRSNYNSRYRKKIQYVKLIPKDSDSEIKFILLGIDTEFNQIYEVVETGKNDTVTTITIIDFEFNIKINKDFFVFNDEKYKNYYMNILD